MIKKQKDIKEKENLTSDTKTAKRINALFERTADEIFYDFFKKYGKLVVGGVTLLIVLVLCGTYQYKQNREYEQQISANIIKLLESDHVTGKDILMIEKQNIKDKHKAALLYLVEIKDKKTLKTIYEEAKKINYVCQYPFTTYHFKKLVVVEELLYLKVLYFLGVYGYKKEMKEFFLAKKMQSSVFSYYAHYLLALFTHDNNILKELMIGHHGFITNNELSFIYYTNKMEKDHNEKI